MNALKAIDGHVSITKIGLILLGIAQGIQSAGIDLVPTSTIDETILKLSVIIGGVLAGLGVRDAISKIGGQA